LINKKNEKCFSSGSRTNEVVSKELFNPEDKRIIRINDWKLKLGKFNLGI